MVDLYYSCSHVYIPSYTYMYVCVYLVGLFVNNLCSEEFGPMSVWPVCALSSPLYTILCYITITRYMPHRVGSYSHRDRGRRGLLLCRHGYTL